MKARLRESGGYFPSVGEYVTGDDGELYRVTSISRSIHSASPGQANYVYGEVEAFWGDWTDIDEYDEPVCRCELVPESGCYAVVVSDALHAYLGSKGSLGYALSKHETLTAARKAAREVADDYHYGVEIVDEATWTVVE